MNHHDPYANTLPPAEIPEQTSYAPPRQPTYRARARQAQPTPLDRHQVRRRRHWFILFLSIVGWAASWAAIITFVMEYEQKRAGAASWDGFGAGLIAAILLTAGQVFNSDDSLLAYLLFLAPDALLTFIQGLPLVQDFVTFVIDEGAAVLNVRVDPDLPIFTSWALMFILAIVFSRLPERVLLGPRIQRLRDRLRRR